jgi:hypothetical protein
MKNLENIIKKVLSNVKKDSTKKTVTKQLGEQVNLRPDVLDKIKQVPNLPSDFFDSLKLAKLRTFEGNTGTFDEDDTILSCLDNKEYISPFYSSVVEWYEITQQSWYDWEMEKFNKGQDNDITACQWYVEILVKQQENGWGDYKDITPPDVFGDESVTKDMESFDVATQTFSKKMTKINYDEEFQKCAAAVYLTLKIPRVGCASSFRLYSLSLEEQGKQDPFLNIDLRSTSWFLTEYKKWTQNPEGYTPKSPAISGADWRYRIQNDAGKPAQYFDFSEVSLDKKEFEVYKPNASKFSTDTFLTLLPLTNSEIARINGNPFDVATGNYKSVNPSEKFPLQTSETTARYVCKKDNVTAVNLRTSAEVNEDTGFFDPYDNYVAWKSDEILGIYLGEKEQTKAPFITSGTLGGANIDEEYLEFLNNITKEDLKVWIKYLEDGGMADDLVDPSGENPHIKETLKEYLTKWLNTLKKGSRVGTYTFNAYQYNDFENKTGRVHPDIWKRFPNQFKPLLWYKIGLEKPYLDQSENTNDYYSVVWVRADNVEFCPAPDSKEASISYSGELLKRLPIRAFADPQ